jgi:hypothetical protein
MAFNAEAIGAPALQRSPLLLVRFSPIVRRFFPFGWRRRLRFRFWRRMPRLPLWRSRPRLGLRRCRFRQRRGWRSGSRRLRTLSHFWRLSPALGCRGGGRARGSNWCRRLRRRSNWGRRLRRRFSGLNSFPRRFAGSCGRRSRPDGGWRRPARSCGWAFRLHSFPWWFIRDRWSRSGCTSRNGFGSAIRLRTYRLSCRSGTSRNNGCDWLTCRHWLRLCDHRRTALIRRYKLLGVLRGCLPLLQLGGHGRHALLAYRGSFHRQRTSRHSSRTVVAGAASWVVDRDVVDDYCICDCAVVHADIAAVQVVRRAVVIEAASAPVPALIASANVAESIINSTVIADVMAPVAVVKTISPAGGSPIARSPQ